MIINISSLPRSVVIVLPDPLPFVIPQSTFKRLKNRIEKEEKVEQKKILEESEIAFWSLIYYQFYDS